MKNVVVIHLQQQSWLCKMFKNLECNVNENTTRFQQLFIHMGYNEPIFETLNLSLGLPCSPRALLLYGYSLG